MPFQPPPARAGEPFTAKQKRFTAETAEIAEKKAARLRLSNQKDFTTEKNHALFFPVSNGPPVMASSMRRQAMSK